MFVPGLTCNICSCVSTVKLLGMIKYRKGVMAAMSSTIQLTEILFFGWILLVFLLCGLPRTAFCEKCLLSMFLKINKLSYLYTLVKLIILHISCVFTLYLYDILIDVHPRSILPQYAGMCAWGLPSGD